MINSFLFGFLKLKDLSKSAIPDCVREHDNDWPCGLWLISSLPDCPPHPCTKFSPLHRVMGEVVGVSNQDSWAEEIEVKHPI